MKRCYILVLLFLPQLLSAQSLDIRGFGGIMMNSNTDHPLLAGQNDISRPNAIGGSGLRFRSGNWEAGLDASYRRYSFVNSKLLRFADQFDPNTGYATGVPVETTVVFKNPAFAIAPVFNYHFGNERLDWYAGISPAFIRYTAAAPTEKGFSFKDGVNGWSVEAQIGASYQMLPRFRLFAEINGGYIRIPYFRRNETSMWAAGMNLGAQFRLWEKPAAAPVSAEPEEQQVN